MTPTLTLLHQAGASRVPQANTPHRGWRPVALPGRLLLAHLASIAQLESTLLLPHTQCVRAAQLVRSQPQAPRSVAPWGHQTRAPPHVHNAALISILTLQRMDIVLLALYRRALHWARRSVATLAGLAVGPPRVLHAGLENTPAR